ncbi:hypothetical protein PLESTB_000655800 [Pleodorina starrii]|uniref:Uncharacterized protein n=1 Tax=Pleodorina starrii TaxID=330485 RepID=A0A9W6BJD2_9CHLO|nr:hypothetical protein PLESTM_001324600 [Pleodorina starrii]GLC52672.1 hypothetical protein PLESTB_000655800 [Pleodorina starrii]GLC71678.1 hypothetical protein PLESTF_001148600 [Pleodorina starrii]
MLAVTTCPVQVKHTRDGGIISATRDWVQRTAIRHCRAPMPAQRDCRSVRVAGIGRDAVDGWLDLAKLVAGGGSSKTPYEEFASAIGRDVYVDIAGWHLYLRDMGTGVPGSSLKMSQALAQQFGPQLNKGLREADVEGLLKKIPVKLGAGKLKASLYDVMPSMCVGDLVRLCEDFARR